MLAADPSSGEVRRFLTGPNSCELTGVVTTPAGRTMFVNIQHPGEPSSERSDPTKPTGISTWPDGQRGGRPLRDNRHPQARRRVHRHLAEQIVAPVPRPSGRSFDERVRRGEKSCSNVALTTPDHGATFAVDDPPVLREAR